MQTQLLIISWILLSVKAEDGISDSDTLPTERGAVYGHSPIPANPKPDDRYFQPLQPSPNINHSPFEDLRPFPHEEVPEDFLFEPVSGVSSAVNFIPDPIKGLEHLDYIQALLENYPTCHNRCDLKLWSQCTCASPATYSSDGRGNCNVGATKPDIRVWCYVDDSRGDPNYVCPDAKPSQSKPGYYWSRIACITG